MYRRAGCSTAATAWLGMLLAGGPPGGRTGMCVVAWSPPAGHQAVRREGRKGPTDVRGSGIGDAQQARHTPLRSYIKRQRSEWQKC